MVVPGGASCSTQRICERTNSEDGAHGGAWHSNEFSASMLRRACARTRTDARVMRKRVMRHVMLRDARSRCARACANEHMRRDTHARCVIWLRATCFNPWQIFQSVATRVSIRDSRISIRGSRVSIRANNLSIRGNIFSIRGRSFNPWQLPRIETFATD